MAHSQSGVRPGESTPALTLAGWALLAAWPYGFSYWIAANLNVRSLISTLVQTFALWLITTLVCGAYVGQLFDSAVSGWGVPIVTVVQSVWLLSACGLGERAAEQSGSTDLPISPARHRIFWAHLILGLVAAGSLLSRSTVWHLDYMGDHVSFRLQLRIAAAMLPHATTAALSSGARYCKTDETVGLRRNINCWHRVGRRQQQRDLDAATRVYGCLARPIYSTYRLRLGGRVGAG